MTWVPLLIALASLALGIYNVVNTVRGDRARINTELSAQIYASLISHKRLLRRIRALKSNPAPLQDDLQKLIASETSYENDRELHETFLGALAEGRLNREQLLACQPVIEGMARQVEVDHQILDELLKP